MVHLLIFKNIICWLIHIFRWFFFLSKKQQTASSLCLGFPGSSAGKESACNAGDPDSTPGSGRAPGEGIGYPFHGRSLMQNDRGRARRSPSLLKYKLSGFRLCCSPTCTGGQPGPSGEQRTQPNAFLQSSGLLMAWQRGSGSYLR